MICQTCFEELKEYVIPEHNDSEKTIYVCFMCKDLFELVNIKGRMVFVLLEKL